MYPYKILGPFDLYNLFLCIGVACAIWVFRGLADKKKVPWRVQQLVVLTAVPSILVGYFSAVLFQAFYNIAEMGKFEINENTGMTFYGGLIGGAACFLAIYFGIGHFIFKKNHENTANFFNVTDIGACSVLIAHGCGRIGCLMAGCCHGGVTDAWYGIYMPAVGAQVVPIQLYEALFLFSLFAFLTFRLIKGKSCNLPIYMAIYGIWRFVIEFFRADERGETIVSFLSPSQFIAILMIFGSVVLFFGQRAAMKWFAERNSEQLLNNSHDDICTEGAENDNG